MVYKFRDGYPTRGMDAEAVGRTLDGLNAKHGGLTAEVVVKAAKPKASPIHNAFTWDDAEAARKCRLREAGSLIRAVVVESDDLPTVRRFVNVVIGDIEDEDGSTRRYMTLDAALADSESREQVLAAAKDELAAFKRKYANLVEVASVIAAIDHVL